MKVRLLVPSVAPNSRLHFPFSVLIDDHIAIDTCGLPYLDPIEAQRAVDQILLTHSHIDHVGGLPLFLDNTYRPDHSCPTIYASEATWDAVSKHLLNDVIWPDLEKIADSETPFFKKQIVDVHRPISIDGYQVTAIPLEHVVPTLGYIFQGEGASVLFCWDTAPFPEFENIVAAIPNLKAIFLDASFPNELRWLAEKSEHTTPGQFGQLVAQIPADVRIIAIHLKPGHHDELIDELNQLGLPNLEIADPHTVYEF
ncbi:MBL fold metallo-hydrolase [bacterium]|nr:MBL fold metallo-hydrolase [bacterium]